MISNWRRHTNKCILLYSLIGSSQIRQLHIFPCTPSDVSFAHSLRKTENNPVIIKRYNEFNRQPLTTKNLNRTTIAKKAFTSKRAFTSQNSKHNASQKGKVINSIYDILRQLDTDSNTIPMQRRKKKWIRSVHDLM